MNCKPGDLAITASRFYPEDNGMLVEVIEYAHAGDYTAPDGNVWSAGGDGWLIRSTGRDFQDEQGPSKFAVYSDSSLRPIRGNEGEDETLAWAGKPIRHVVNEAFDEARIGAA